MIVAPREIEVDARLGVIAFHDARPKLRQAFTFWWVFAIAGAVIVLASTAGLLFFLLNVRGAVYAIKGVSKALVGMVPAIGLGAGMLALGLYRQARAARRYLDPQPDLVLSPQGLDDRWLGLGIIPWDRIHAAELHMQRPFNRPGVAIRLKHLDGWLDTLPAKAKRRLRWKFWMADRFGDRFRLSQTGGETFSAGLCDLLYALACHIPVSGLPVGYVPQNPALRGLTPPPDNLFPRPEMAVERIDTTPVEIRLKPQRGRDIVGAVFCLGGAGFLTFLLAQGIITGLPGYAAAGGIMLLLYGVVACLRHVFAGAQAELRADVDGLRLRSYRHYPPIRWHDILGFESNIERDRFTLYVDIRDIARYDQVLWPWCRLYYQCRRWFGGSLRAVLLKPEGSMQVAMERIRALHVRARAEAAGLLPPPPSDPIG